MSSDLQQIREYFSAVARDIQSLAFIPRDMELQQEALQEARRLSATLRAYKTRAIEGQDELSANEALLMELATGAITSQLQMCIALKQNAAEAAWDHLVDAQYACEAAINVRRQLESGPDASQLENLLSHLVQTEVTVFPPQAFMSIGGTVDDRQCSICGQQYDDCGHIKGRAYMGRMCHTILRSVRLEEVSLVFNPANKRARVTRFSDGNGKRNKMTWRLEGDADAPAAERGIEADKAAQRSSAAI